MKKEYIFILIMILLITAAIWIVRKSSSPEVSDIDEISRENDVEMETKSAEISSDTILIGAISARTGDASEINKTMFIALEYAVAELNERGGILGKEVQIMEFDNESNALGSKKAAQEAVDAGVIAVIGALRSSNSIASAEVLQEAGIPMISPTSTNPALTEIGDYIFRACFNDNFQAEVLANFSINDLKAKSAVTFTNVNRIFSISLSEIYKENFEKMGGKFLQNVDYLDSETDYSDIIQNIVKLQPDVIMIPSEVRDAGLIIKQSRDMGITAKFIGPDSWGPRMFVFAGDAAEDSYFSTHWHHERDTLENKAFLDSFPDRENQNIRAVYPLTYDSLTILADAIKRAGNLDRKAIRNALFKTKNLNAISGRITFNELGDPIGKSAVILKLTDGEVVFHQIVDSE